MNETLFLALMDPAGAPAHPLIFLVLGVVTFALHIAAVALLLGTLVLAIRGAIFSRDAYAQRLARPVAFTAKFVVGMVIVLGVAPLLFVQVVYDPFWYTSSMLSAGWTLAFLVLVLAGYLALYVFALANDEGGENAGPGLRRASWLVVSLIVFIAGGWVIHSLSTQLLLPSEFMQWYAPQGRVDPSGRALHYSSIPRLVFFLGLAFPITAAWLFGMRAYLLGSQERDGGYIDYLEMTGRRTAFIGGIVLLVSGAAWMLTLPASMQWFASSIWPWAGLVPVIFFLALPALQKKRRLCIPCNYGMFLMSIVMTIVLAALREVLRYGTLLQAAGYDAMQYKVNFDLPSTVIFFVTFLLIGGVALAYMIRLAWQAGRPQGAMTVSAGTERLGTAAVALLLAWVAGYFIIGIATITGAG